MKYMVRTYFIYDTRIAKNLFTVYNLKSKKTLRVLKFKGKTCIIMRIKLKKKKGSICDITCLDK